MKTKIRILSVALSVLMLVALISACTQDPAPDAPAPPAAPAEAAPDPVEPAPDTAPDEAASSDQPKRLAILLCYKGDEYVLDQETAFIYYAAQKGWEVYVEDGNLDPNEQTRQIEDAITKKVDAIAIQAMDPEALIAPAEEAFAAGIPVFTFNAPINSETIISHIGFDELGNGRNAALWAKEYVENELGGSARIAILDLPIAVNTCVKRVAGFKEIMDTLPDVEYVAQQDGQADRSVCMSLAENMLTAHPEINMFFGINYETAAGAAAAIEAAGRTDIVSIAGGWGREMFEVLEANDPILRAMWLQSGVAEAEATWNTMVDYFEGKTVDDIVYVIPQVPYVTHENVGQIDYLVADRMKEELKAMGN